MFVAYEAGVELSGRLVGLNLEAKLEGGSLQASEGAYNA